MAPQGQNGQQDKETSKSPSRGQKAAAPINNEAVKAQFLAYVEQNAAALAEKIVAYRRAHSLLNWSDLEDYIKTQFRSDQSLPTNQPLSPLTSKHIKLLQEHLDKSHVQKHPIKYGLMGSALVLLIGFATAFLVMIAVQAFATVAVMPAIIAALSFLSFLTPLGPIVGILAFSAIIAGVMLPLYGLFVATAHKATQPAPFELINQAFEAEQRKGLELSRQLNNVEHSRTDQISAKFQSLEEVVRDVRDTTTRIFEAINKREHQSPRDQPNPSATQYQNPLSASTGHPQTLLNSSAANPGGSQAQTVYG